MTADVSTPRRRRPRLFYGWWMALSGMYLMFYTTGVSFFGFSAFFDSIRLDLKLDARAGLTRAGDDGGVYGDPESDDWRAHGSFRTSYGDGGGDVQRRGGIHCPEPG